MKQTPERTSSKAGGGSIEESIYPLLVANLFARRGGAGSAVIRRPDGQEFQIYDFEWELAQKMDGRRSLEDLVEDARRLGLPANLATISRLVRELKRYGIVQVEGLEQQTAVLRLAAPRADQEQTGQRSLAELGDLGPASIIAQQLARGEIALAAQICERGLQEAPEDPDLLSYARLLATLRAKHAPSTEGNFPALAEFHGTPELLDVERLLEPVEQLLRAGKTDEAGRLLDIAEELAGTDARVVRLARWLRGGAELPRPSPAASEVAVDLDDDGESEQEDPESSLTSDWTEKAAKAAQAKRRALRTAALIAGGIALAAIIPYPLKLTEQAELRPATRSEVRSSTSGVITALLKREGDQLQAGDTIAELDLEESRSKLEVLDAQRGELNAQLAKLRGGSRPEEIKQAYEVVAGATVARNFAQRKLKREHQLFANQLASQDELDAAKFNLEIKNKELGHAAAELALVRAGSRSEDIQAKKAEVERLDAELRFARDDLARKEIETPIAGVLITPHLDETLGRAVQKGDLVAEVAQLNRMRAEILVPESEMGSVQLGQKVLLKVESFPSESFSGTVQFIPVTATYIELKQMSVVRVAAFLDNPKLLLRDRMTGWAEIDCGKHSVLFLLLRSLVRWIRVRFLI